MAHGITLVEKLITAFLSGFAISLVVNLVVFPVSSRKVIFGEMAGYIQALQGVIKAQGVYLQSFQESLDTVTDQKRDKFATGDKNLKAALGGLTAIHGKLAADLIYAKREIAYGKLDAKDLSELHEQLRRVFLPLWGLGSVSAIFRRVSDFRVRSDIMGGDPETGASVDREKSRWCAIMKVVLEPFEQLSSAATDGLLHCSYTLELSKKPKPNKATGPTAVDPETCVEIGPGDPRFTESLATKIQAFSDRRESALKIWCELNGVEFPVKPENLAAANEALFGQDHDGRRRQQLYLVLYVR